MYAANTLLTCPASAACTDAQSNLGGTAQANNSFTMMDVDVDGDPSTFNSSSANFTLPAGANVQWAGLFWGASSNNASRNQVLFETPTSAGYLPITAPGGQLYNLGGPYQGWADVTSQVQAAGSGTYTVANVQRSTGRGQYAGWSLVVVVEDPNEPFRNLAVFPGLERVNSANPVDITVSGFLSPPVGPVTAEIGFVAYEGDERFTGDFAELNGTRLGDALNPTTNFFNSRISDGGSLPTGSNPNYLDQLGFDAKIVNTVGIVPPGATSATVQLRSAGDWYYPGVVTTAIDIFVPNLVLDLEKSVDDINGGDVNPGDTLTYEITFTNQGEDAALDTILTDAIPAGTTYLAGSGEILSGDNVGTSNVVFDAVNDELVFYLGTGASAGTGGRVAPFSSTGTTYTVQFQVTVDAGTEGTTIDNTGTLGYTAETLGESYTADTNTVSDPVEALSNVVLDDKTDSVDSVVAGESTVYTITFSNDGPSSADNTTVVDTLPVGFVFDPATSSASCSVTSGSPATGQTVSCNVGALAAGANGSVDIGVDVEGAVAAGTYANRAEVTTTTAESNPSDNFGREATTVTRLVDLALDKAFAPNPASAGGQITYTLTATNNGPSDAQNVMIVDGLPGGVTFSSVDDPACSHTAGTITCSYASLAAGDTVVATITVDVPASTPDGTVFTNKASISSSDPEDPAGDPNTDSTNTPVGRAADLEIAKTSAGPFVAGTTVLFDLEISNAGPSDATNVVVQDNLPEGTIFNAGLSSSGCSLSGTTVTCNLAALAAGDTASFTIAVDLPETLADGTDLTNSASVEADELDPTPENNTDEVDFTVEREADLAIVKSVTPGNVAAGGDLTYVIDVTNNGPSEATGVTVTDTLPAGVTLVSAPGCASTSTLTCAIGTVASGGTAQITIVVNVQGTTPDGTDLVNAASVSGNETDPEATNNDSQATATVDRTTVLEITKAESSGIVDPALAGTAISWDLAVINLGTSTDTNVVITDDLSAFPLTNIAATITGTANSCSVTGGVVTCSVPSLQGTPGAPANAVTVTITADLDADIVDGTVLENTATADGDFSNEATGIEETTINRRADLELEKTGPGEITAGTSATWIVTVTNNGPGQADNVEITDVLPPSATYVSHTVTAGSATCVASAPVVCDAGDLAPGAVVTIEFVAEIAPTDADGSSVTNTAFVETDTIDPDPTNDEDSVDADIVRSADLEIAKTVLDDPVTAGEGVRFTVSVNNNGPSVATGVTVTDPIPAGMTFDAAASDATCSQVGSDVVCPVGSLNPGAPPVDIVIAFTVDPSQPVGDITNTASVAGNEDDPDTSNGSASDDVTVETVADVELTKSSSATPMTPGEPYSWDLEVTNNGPSDALNAIATDTLPPGATFNPATSSTGCTVTAGTPTTGQTITCTLGTLTPAEIVNLTIGADIDPALTTSPVVNSASIDSDTTDPTPGNNDSDDSSPVVPAADLELTKTGDAVALAGNDVTWELTVTNNGPSDAANVVVTDTLPIGVTFDPATSDATCVVTAGTPGTGQTVTCTLNTVSAGSVIALAVSGTSDPTLLDGATITNDASVDSDTNDPDPSNNDDDHDTEIDRSADLAVTKLADPTTVTAGGQVTYTLTLTNNGPSAATLPTLADPLAAGLTLDSFTLLTPGSCSGAISCSITELLPGDSIEVELTVTVDPTAAAGTITNTATGTAPEDPDGASATEDITVTLSADLAVTKVADPITVNAGEQVTFTITVDNLGLSQATGVTITDPIPAGMTFVPTGSDPSCSQVGSNIVCNLGTIQPSATAVSVDLVFVVDSAAATSTLTNTATASANEPDPDPDNDADSVDVDITNAADLSLTKTSPATAPVPGESYEWNLEVTNDGPSNAAAVIVTDTLPPGATFDPASSSPACSVTGGTPATGQTITCVLGTITADGVVNLTIATDLDSDLTGSLTNAASVDSDTTDPNPSNNDDTDDSTLEPAADLSLVKTAPTTATAGEPISWLVDVANNGPSDAVNATVTDTLPVGVAFDPATSSTGCTVTAGTPTTGETITCTLGNIAPGDVVNLTIGADIDPTTTGPIANSATTDSDTPDPDSSNNDDDTSTDVDRIADLAVSKTADPTTVTPGGQVIYTIRVTNDGPSSATNISVTDPMAAGLTAVSATPLGAGLCTITGGVVTCDVATLAVGTSATFEIVASIDSSIANGATLTNTASASSDEDDPDGASASEDITNDRSADLVFDKVLTTAAPVAGEPVSFNLDVTNNGLSDASNIVITDPLPAGTTFDAATSSPLCSLVGSSIVCSITTLVVGNSISVPITLIIDSDVPDGSTFTNSASVTADEDDPDTTNNDDDADVDVERLVDLSVDKVAPAAPPIPGTTTSWTINVANAGPSDANNVVVTDTLPVGLTFDPATSDARCAVSAGTPASGETVTCVIPLLADGASESLLIGADVAADLTGEISNTAAADSDETDSDPSNNSDTASSTAEPSADLALTKTAVTDPIVAGEPVEYTIEITNAGPSDATNVVVADTFPSVLTFDDPASDASCDLVGADVVCAIGSIAAGASTSITLSFDLDESSIDGSTITNTATVGSDVPDPNSTNDSDDDESVVTRSADLWIDKTGPATLTAGGTGTYTVTAGNDGPSTATGVVFSDAVPAGLTVTGISGPAFCSFTASAVTCTVGTVAPGTSFTLIVDVAVDASVADLATLTNSASISGNEPDPDPDDNDDAVSSTVERSADLETAKTVLTDPIVPGEPALFEITVTNNGPSDASGVTITDTLATGLTFRPDLSSVDCVAGVTCSLATLPAGTDVTFIVGVDVISTLPDGSTVANTAAAAANETDPDPTNDAGSDAGPVTRSADLAIVKSGPATPATAGTQLTWTLDIINEGPSDATNVVVTDTLPAGASFDVAGSDSRCVVATGAIECTIGTMADGATDQLVIVVDVSSTLSDGSLLTNTAAISGDENDPNADNNSSEHTADIERLTGLSLTKFDVDDIVVAGETIGWDLTVENLGPSASDNVVITDTLPIGVTFDPAASDAVCLVTAGTPTSGQTVTCTLGTLDTGDTVTVRIGGGLDQALLDGQQLINEALASGDNATDGTAQEETTIDRVADVTVIKETTTSPIVPGVPVTYSITVTNNGPSQATNVEMTDLLPAGASLLDITGPVTCATTSGTAVCPVGTLDNGESAAFTIQLLPASYLVTGDDFVNQASITADEDEDGDADDSTEPIARSVDLSITKTASTADVAAGAGLTFELTVTNTGPSDASNVVVTDNLPDGLTFDPATSAADCTASGQIVTCTTLTVAANTSASFVVGVIVDSTVTGTLTNTAAVASDEPNTNSDPTDDATVAVGEEADLELTKVGPTTVIAGESVTYSFAVSNAGPSVARNVTITDILPAELSVTTLPSECSAAGTPATITCLVGDIAPGDTIEFEFDVLLDSTANSTVRNVATVSSNATDPNPDNDVATTLADVDRVADLDVSKTLDTDDVVAGGTAVWTVTVTNNGPSSATNVVVTDDLPAGLTFVAGDSSALCDEDSTGLVSCNVPGLAVGDSAELTITTDVDDTLNGSITNSATAVADEADSDGAEAEATGAVRRSIADLQIRKSVVAADLTTNGLTTWSVVVSNNGPDDIITPLTISDSLPPSVTYVSHTITGATPCTVTGQLLSCTLENGLASDGSITLEIVTRTVTTTDLVENTARVSASGLAGEPDGVVEIAAAAAAQRPATPPSPLAFTGSTTSTIVSTALLLLLMGGGALLLSRRQRRAVRVTAAESAQRDNR